MISKPMRITHLIIFSLCLASVGCTRIVGQGAKVGTVIKLSQEGFFVKTWEGELIRGGLANGGGGFSITPLHFTVNDAGLLKSTQDALDGQYEVEVTYTEYFFTPIASQNKGYFLNSIRRRVQ